jgi:hypothetical protein
MHRRRPAQIGSLEIANYFEFLSHLRRAAPEAPESCVFRAFLLG